jgi:hypothetical protein
MIPDTEVKLQSDILTDVENASRNLLTPKIGSRTNCDS